MNAPLRVAVTGAAGNISYSLLWRLASGNCFGPDQPIILQLLEIPPAMSKLEGVVMELTDSAFPLVQGIEATDDAKKAFDGVNAAFLVGSRPRSAGMDRADLVAANGPIFVGQGEALNHSAAADVKVIVVGNPCNTNCLIANANAPDIPAAQFTAMTRLDQNRAVGQIANKTGVAPAAIENVAIWGNHADTMYPDISLATINGSPAAGALDDAWLRGEFLKTVATRGKAIIHARGASSAASAASAAIDHMRDWHLGTGNRIVSMAVPSTGAFGVPEGLVFSFPVRCSGGAWEIVEDFPIDDFARAKIEENVKALEGERSAVSSLL